MFDFFGLIETLTFIAWIFIILTVAYLIRIRRTDNPIYKYYLPHIFWKLGLSTAFALVYMYYYDRHGDTVFYWDGANKLNLLFYENPSAYFNEIFGHYTGTPPRYFEAVGYPPRWIYAEENSWFVSKIGSFLGFFSFGSYITLNLLFTVVSSYISWRFFLYMDKILDIKTRFLALACLFIPSVGFWCSGIIKDTIAISCILIIVIQVLRLLRKDYNFVLLPLITLITASYFLYSIRPFLIVATYLPFFVVLIFKWNAEKAFVIKFLTRFFGVGIAAIGLLFYMRSETAFGEFSANSVINTAEVIQKDLANNTGYTGKRYDLGVTDFSGTGMLNVAPAAITVALFRPFLWEADSVFMLMNGLENLLVLFLALRLIWKIYKKQSKTKVFKTEIYLFAFIFVLLLGYFVGLTSGLFGTLVRLKAPILPFFLMFILMNDTEDKTTENTLNNDSSFT